MRFYCPTAIVTGPAGRELKKLGCRRLLMVADPYFQENGLLQQLLEEAGAPETEVFSRISPDPSVMLAAEGTAVLQAFRPDTVVALGGGSTIDCAKAMVYFSGLELRFVAIPTTSGSGSEVTDFSILTHGGIKHPLIDERLRPDVAILDGSLLGKLPKRLIAETGFDLLSHGVEAFVATGAGMITDALAKEAFSAGLSMLEASFLGDLSARERIHQAACMAGMAFSGAGLGLCHAMSHSLGGLLHISHGRLNAILLPAVVEANGAVAGKKYAQLARAAGLSGVSDTLALRNLKNALVRLRRRLELPATLAEAGAELSVLRQQKAQLVAAVLEDPCCAANPLPVTEGLIYEILGEVQGFGE